MGQAKARKAEIEALKATGPRVIGFSNTSDLLAYMASRQQEAQSEWDQMCYQVNQRHTDSNALHVIPAQHTFTYGPKGRQLTFDFCKGVQDKDALVRIWNKDKYIALNFNFHEKSNLNWNDEVQGCNHLEKTLTSLVLMASDGTIGAFSVWNEVVKSCADAGNMIRVFRVLD